MSWNEGLVASALAGALGFEGAVAVEVALGGAGVGADAPAVADPLPVGGAANPPETPGGAPQLATRTRSKAITAVRRIRCCTQNIPSVV